MRFYWHCHHEVLIEDVPYGEKNFNLAARRQYIRSDKPLYEQPLRLLLFRRAKVVGEAEARAVQTYIEFGPASKLLKKMHAEQCEKDCPWNGNNIFIKFSHKLGRYVTKRGR